MAVHMNPAQLRAAGRQMQEAGRGAGKTSPHQDLDTTPGALPGSESGPAAKTLAGTWMDRFADWKRDAESFGDLMVDEADGHQQADEWAAVRLEQPATALPSAVRPRNKVHVTEFDGRI